MKQTDLLKKDAVAALKQQYEKACDAVEFLAKEAIRYQLWEQADFGQRLSDLYLRLKQGPVRAVIMGQTSSGKSTLINALVGSIMTPESADACSPIPICFLQDKKQISETHITYFEKMKHALPAEKYANQSLLLQWHHDAGTLAEDNGNRPFVHTISETFPHRATLIDSPGLNANGADTDKLYALFKQPSYATDDEPDFPEIVLYITTTSGNLSEEEMKSLRCLLEMGIDPQRIFVVHNELCADLDGLQPEQFECTDEAAKNGLAESFRALLPAETPDFLSADTDDGAAFFDAFLGGAFGDEAFPADENDAEAHIISLNALFARVFYAGGYNPTANLITGATQDQYQQLLAAKNNPKQDRVIKLCAAWKQQNHTDYGPLLQLRDLINEQALKIAETEDAGAAIRAVSRLGNELLEMRIRQLRDEAVQQRKPILEWAEQLESFRVWLDGLHDDMEFKVQKWHDAYASRFIHALMDGMQKQAMRLRCVAKDIADSASETAADRFWKGARDGRRISMVERLASGLILASSANKLKNEFDSLLGNNPYFSAADGQIDQQLLLVYQQPVNALGIFAALEEICKQMMSHLNQTQLKPDEDSLKFVRQVLEEHGPSLTNMLRDMAMEIQNRLSALCQSCGNDEKLLLDLLKLPRFSDAVHARFQYKPSPKSIEQLLKYRGDVLTAVRAAMTHPLHPSDHIAQQIRKRCNDLRSQMSNRNHHTALKVSLENVRKFTFQQVICPSLVQEVTDAVEKMDTQKIGTQLDRFMALSQVYAVQSLEKVILNGYELVTQCYDVLKKHMDQWREPEEDDDVNRIARVLAIFEQDGQMN